LGSKSKAKAKANKALLARELVEVSDEVFKGHHKLQDRYRTNTICHVNAVVYAPPIRKSVS